MVRFVSSGLFWIFSGWVVLIPLSQVSRADAASKLSPRFFADLEKAKTAAEQNDVIRNAQPSIAAEEVRKELLAHIYQIALAGEYLRAAQDCELVMRLAREANAPEDTAAAQINLAYVLRESGDLTGSLDAIDKALAFYRAHPEHVQGLISAHQSRGITYLAQSDFVHALESFQQALVLSQKINHREGIIPALNSLGEVYRDQGQPARALEYYERARKAVGDDDAWNMAFIFNNIGMSYDALGEIDRAIDFINRAKIVAERVNFRPRVVNSLAVLGDLELKRGNFDRSAEFYEKSLRVAREISDVPGEAQATLGAAMVAQARGENEVALKQAQIAAQLYRNLGQTVHLASALTINGRCLRALGRHLEAGVAFADAIGAVEDVRGQVAGGDEEREAFFAQEIAPYQEMISLLAGEGKSEQALAMAERASARVLLDIAGHSQVARSELLSTSEQELQRSLEIKLASTRRDLVRLRAAQEPDSVALAEGERIWGETRDAREEFETKLVAAHPDLRRAALPPPLVSIGDLAPLLEQGKTALLRYVVTNDQSYVFVITLSKGAAKPQLRLKSLGQKRAALARLTNDFRSRLAARSLAWEAPARDLYDLLVRPVEQELAGVESLVIVPDGPLWELPFQALERETDHPVLTDRTVRYAPSLTWLKRQPPSIPYRALDHELLAFVNPALDGPKEEKFTKVALMDDRWQSLPETELQAAELEKIYPPPRGEVFVGADAREKVFKQKAPQAGILHFAMHGVLDDRAPLYSYLLFSQVGVAPDEDGRLEARELMRLKLGARLAILCGCETARGQVTAGEGIVGLSWSFMVAGCPATIVSQWKVESASSTPLMIELHRQLRAGSGNAEALRAASLELRKDAHYHHPFYWAPFVLVGAGS